jgi:signal transduction histidine kinase
MLATVAALLVIELVLFGALGIVLHMEFAVSDMKNVVVGKIPSIRENLEATPIDPISLKLKVLETITGGSAGLDGRSKLQFLVLVRPKIRIAVVGTGGAVLVGLPEASWRTKAPILTQITPTDAVCMREAMNGKTVSMRVTDRIEGPHNLVAAPVFGKNGRLVGAVYVRMETSYGTAKYLSDILPIMLLTALIMATAGALVGALFGAIASRGLALRIDAISKAAKSWGGGNFSAAVVDGGADEVGALAADLNRMAAQLQQHIRVTQRLAALEERNRLAGDLHDTVKQETFALALRIGAATTYLDSAPALAKAHLLEAEGLTLKVQQDLTAILQELHPPSGENVSLKTSIEKCVVEWANRTQVALDLHIDDISSAPIAIRQAFVKITLGALSNIARHSDATSVLVELAITGKTLSLRITDDGRGFTPSSPPGLGLRLMRERAEALPDGELNITSSSGGGATVEVRCRSTEEDRHG